MSYVFDALKSRERWLHMDSYKTGWGRRAEIAARFIPPGSSVIDIGCGRMQLRDHLPHGCSYTAADLKRWTDEVIEIDIDQGRMPHGRYDYAVMLGVIEHVHSPEQALAWARANCTGLVTSYLHAVTPRPDHKNGFSERELADLLHRTGWRIEKSAIYKHNWKAKHVVYACSPSRHHA